MFGCLGRLGCLAVLLLAGAYAFLTRERWLPRVLGQPGAAPVTWESVNEAGARKPGEALASLRQKGGPAFVTVSAAELATMMVESSEHRLPAALDSVQAAVDGDRVRVRALVKLDDIRGLEALGPLSGLLDNRERIELTGTLRVLSPGLGEFRVASVKIADLSLPQAAIPRLLSRLDSRKRPLLVAPDGIPITIPDYIGDVRVAGGQVTLYKRAP